MRFFLTLLILSHILFIDSIAQQNFSGAGSNALNVQFHYGFLIAHRPSIIPLQQNHSPGFEISWHKTSSGKKTYQQIYKFPETGLTYVYMNPGNEKVLGHAHGIYPFIELPLSLKKNYQFKLRMGYGVGWITRPFTQYDNYKNTAIGSNLNVVIALRLINEWKISDTWHASANLAITHYSNGSAKTPNLGINIVTIGAGIKKYFGKPRQQVIDTVFPNYKKWKYQFLVAGFSKEIYPALGKKYFAGSLVGNAIMQVSNKSAFDFGADIFYDASLKTKLTYEGNYTSAFDNSRYGIHTGYRLLIGNFTTGIDVGIYVYQKWKEDGMIYNRIIIEQQLTKHLLACFNLKAHYAKADYFEAGLGWRF